ncbi:MAG: site-specific integrase [Muribaculaceae bacterium]|nr:site-specific integrase [Muribaculaceae bacterium]
MNKQKQKEKIKEPVRIRTKSLANGNKSLYLDTYKKGKRVYEFLRLYLIPEKTAADKAINAATMKAAIAIKAKRILEFINGKAGIKTSDCKITIQEWIDHIIKAKASLQSHSSMMLMKRLLKHLQKYRPAIGLADIDREFCIGFAEYLRSAHALNSPKPLMQTTQFELLNALSVVLNEAVRSEFIVSNPMRLLNATERIKKSESMREYLTPDEVKSMIAVSSDNISAGDDVAAFLFCCFCGLRYSDVSRLTWADIIDTGEGRKIIMTMKKTHRCVEVPVSEMATSLLPMARSADARVFVFPKYAVTLKKLRKTANAAGINKKVTFHVSRHTFATMMLTAGADLYTISKLIGHADIRTTQIYSKVVDKKKQQAITLLDKLF